MSRINIYGGLGCAVVLATNLACPAATGDSGSEPGSTSRDESGPETSSTDASVSGTSVDVSTSTADGTVTGESTTSNTSDATTGSSTSGGGADCEDSGGQWSAAIAVDFGDWPPTGVDSLGDDTWDVDVQCRYGGPSPVLTGILLECDDDRVTREVDLQYGLWPAKSLPPIEIDEPLLLRAHTGDDEWIVLSRESGELIILGIFGTPGMVLADQTDYAPFGFDVARDLCPVNACERQLGLDVTIERSTTRIFEGPPIDIAAPSGPQYAVFVEGLFQSTDEVEPDCYVDEQIGFVILADM